MLDIKQIAEEIWPVVAKRLEPCGVSMRRNALQLVMGTGAQESRFTYIRQLAKGPALGLWQMEPATEYDLIKNFIRYRMDLHNAMMRFPRYAELYRQIKAEETETKGIQRPAEV